MGFEKRIPIKLEKDPIIECVLEIRFESQMPSDAVFGSIYQCIVPDVRQYKLNTLPILNIPSEIREKELALRYQAWWQILYGRITIGISPNMVSFSVGKPYCGWQAFSRIVSECVKNLIDARIIHRVSRIGLRYINLFMESLTEVTGLKVNTESDTLDNNLIMNMNYLEKDGDVNLNCRLGNGVEVNINNKPSRQTVIDIDSFFEQIYPAVSFKKDYANLFENLHAKEKERFFRLLTDNYTSSLGPVF